MGLEKSVVLLAASRFWTEEKRMQRALIRSYAERYELLAAAGYQPMILGIENDTSEDRTYARFMDCMEDAVPGSVFVVAYADLRDRNTLVWPRDQFAVYGERLLATHSFAEKVFSSVLHALDAPVHYDLHAFGEGGAVVHAGSAMIVSPYIRWTSIEDFEEDGWFVQRMPIPKRREKGLLRERMRANPHVDLEMNILQADSSLYLFVNELYAQRFSAETRTLAANMNAGIRVVPREEEFLRPVNFVMLPEGHVLFPSGCPKTQAMMECILGPEKLLVTPVTAYDHARGGGLRCRSAVLPVSYLERARLRPEAVLF